MCHDEMLAIFNRNKNNIITNILLVSAASALACIDVSALESRYKMHKSSDEALRKYSTNLVDRMFFNR